MQTRNYAARKATRERYRERTKRKKVKAIVEKVGFIPPKKSDKSKEVKLISPARRINDSWKVKAVDNVWPLKYFQHPVYSFTEIIEFHRETHHPTMYNKPSALVNAFIELNMTRQKKNKYFESFSKIIEVPHGFTTEKHERKVLAFCKNLEEQRKAKDVGADFVGGVELIKQIQSGSFPYKEYNYIVAHADILTDLLLVRGLLKKKFPNIKSGTLGNNMSKLVKKFKTGVHCVGIADKKFKEYGVIDTTFGLLDMNTKDLEENFHVLIQNIASMKPNPEESFIRRIQIKSELSRERFIINFEQYLPEEVEEQIIEQEDNTAIIASN